MNTSTNTPNQPTAPCTSKRGAEKARHLTASDLGLQPSTPTIDITTHPNGCLTVTDTATGYSIAAWQIGYGAAKGRYEIRGPRRRGYGAVLTATCAADRLAQRCTKLFVEWAETFAAEAKYKADNAAYEARVAATKDLWRGLNVYPEHASAGYARLSVDVPDARAEAFVAACAKLGISL